MKTNTFEEKLDEILERTHLQGRKDPDGYGKAIEGGKQAIIDLVLNDVIGEDEVEDTDLSKSAKSRWRVRARNRVRDDQRAIVKGGNHED